MSEETNENITENDKLALAYREVFGPEHQRTETQQLVWEDLQHRASHNQSIFRPDKLGQFNPLNAAHIDGARTLFLGISRMIRKADRKPRMIRKADRKQPKIISS
jgi:hypothetical protein